MLPSLLSSLASFAYRRHVRPRARAAARHSVWVVMYSEKTPHLPAVTSVRLARLTSVRTSPSTCISAVEIPDDEIVIRTTLPSSSRLKAKRCQREFFEHAGRVRPACAAESPHVFGARFAQGGLA